MHFHAHILNKMNASTDSERTTCTQHTQILINKSLVKKIILNCSYLDIKITSARNEFSKETSIATLHKLMFIMMFYCITIVLHSEYFKKLQDLFSKYELLSFSLKISIAYKRCVYERRCIMKWQLSAII